MIFFPIWRKADFNSYHQTKKEGLAFLNIILQTLGLLGANTDRNRKKQRQKGLQNEIDEGERKSQQSYRDALKKRSQRSQGSNTGGGSFDVALKTLTGA